MSIDEIIEFVEGLEGVLTVRAKPGDGSPEIAWGDVFVFYAPDGVVPKQPFASIVTKDYPDDEKSRLDRPDRFRVNVGAGTEEFQRYAGHPPREPVAADANLAEADVVISHPVYGYLGWLAVVNPAARTEATLRELLRGAHERARSRYERRRSNSR